MRMSCNGCRVLRKGCSDNCSIRPCLDWIKSPDAQANATLFLAKFYGRAGLLNLINAGPTDLRPAIFKSLLYEACGRIVNPIYGSSGLLWTGSWSLCQSAVEAVLKGSPITPIPTEESTEKNNPCLLLPFEACDIRHVSKNDGKSSEQHDLHKLLKPVRRSRFKRSRLVKAKLNPNPAELMETKSGSSKDGSGLSHHSGAGAGGDVSSAETVEVPENEVRVGLDLTLWFGIGSGSGSGPAHNEMEGNLEAVNGSDDDDGSDDSLALGLGVAC